MRKMNLFIGMLFVICMLISCSGENVVVEANPVQGDCKTLTELKKFNQEKTSVVLTRGWVERFLGISSADILGIAAGIGAGQKIAGFVGAVTGGTGYFVTSAVCGAICGASASCTAYNYTRRTRNSDIPALHFDSLRLIAVSDSIYKGNLRYVGTGVQQPDGYAYNEAFSKVNMPEKFNYLKRVGEDHNGIVNVVMTMDEDYSLSSVLRLEKLRGVIPPLDVTSGDLDSLIFKNPRFVSSYERIHRNIENCIDEDGNMDVDLFFKVNPMVSTRVERALKYYVSLFETYPENIDEVAEITNRYIGIIERNGEFTDEEKEIIYAAVTVALYSPQIWNGFE